MQKALQASAVIYGLLAAVASLLLGAGFLLAFVGPGNREGFPIGMVLFSLIAVGGGLGLMLAWAAWRGLAGRPSQLLHVPPFWLLVGLFMASVVLGELLLRSGADLLLPVINVLATMLPALALVALVVVPLRRSGVVLTRRDLALQFAYGGLVATLLSGVAQLAAALGVIAGAGLLISWLPDGPKALEELSASLQSPDLLSDPQELLSQLLSPPLVLAGLLFVAVLVPALEEVFKSLGVALVAAGRGHLSPAQALAMGVMAGVGFSFVEAVFGSAAIPVSGWAGTVLLRGGTAVIHGLATGLMGLAWQAAIIEHRAGPFLGYAAAGVGLHGAWNAVAILGALVTSDLASTSPGQLGSDLSLPGLLLLLPIWLGAGLVLVWLTRRLATPAQGSAGLPLAASEI